MVQVGGEEIVNRFAASLALLALALNACMVSGSREAGQALPAESTLPPERAAAIDRMLSQFADLGMFNGVVIIDQGGVIVFHRAYGLADYGSGTPFSDRTRFRIASISKSMTDAALAGLIQQGALQLGDTVAMYLPDFPGGDRISVEHLVTHRSGIAHTNDQPWGDGGTYLTLDEIIARLSATPLDFEPGSERRYSNGGYAVLVRIMEIAAGRSYPDLMEELIFQPLRMRDAGVILDSSDPIPLMAVGYEPGSDIGVRGSPRRYLPETRPGAGSLYASPQDVMSFFQAAYRGGLPGALELPLLFGGEGPVRGADGRAPGYYTDVYNHRAADLIVVSTANNYAAEFRWAENIGLMAMGQPPLFDGPPAVDLTRPADLAWLGRYEFGGTSMEVRRNDLGQLTLTESGDGARALIPLAAGGYLEPMYYGLCSMPDPEHVQCGRLYEGGFTMRLSRQPGPAEGSR